MGTNYYCYEKNHRRRHIGKQSAGWCFFFRAHDADQFYPEVKTYEAWKNHLSSKKYEIFDECHEKIKKRDFFKMIEKYREEKKRSPDDTKTYIDSDSGFPFCTEWFG